MNNSLFPPPPNPTPSLERLKATISAAARISAEILHFQASARAAEMLDSFQLTLLY